MDACKIIVLLLILCDVPATPAQNAVTSPLPVGTSLPGDIAVSTTATTTTQSSSSSPSSTEQNPAVLTNSNTSSSSSQESSPTTQTVEDVSASSRNTSSLSPTSAAGIPDSSLQDVGAGTGMGSRDTTTTSSQSGQSVSFQAAGIPDTTASSVVGGGGELGLEPSQSLGFSEASASPVYSSSPTAVLSTTTTTLSSLSVAAGVSGGDYTETLPDDVTSLSVTEMTSLPSTSSFDIHSTPLASQLPLFTTSADFSVAMDTVSLVTSSPSPTDEQISPSVSMFEEVSASLTPSLSTSSEDIISSSTSGAPSSPTMMTTTMIQPTASSAVLTTTESSENATFPGAITVTPTISTTTATHGGTTVVNTTQSTPNTSSRNTTSSNTTNATTANTTSTNTTSGSTTTPKTTATTNTTSTRNTTTTTTTNTTSTPTYSTNATTASGNTTAGPYPTNTTMTADVSESVTMSVRYLFTLKGDCRLILNNSHYFQRFLQGFDDLLVKQLKVTEKYKLGDISCGSVNVYVTFDDVMWPDFDVTIQSAIRNGGPGLSVPVWMDNYFATFDLSRAKHVPLDPTDSRTYSLVTEVMDDVDIIVIIVACCVCGVLIAIGVVICVKECYRRKHAQSFNLLDVPHVNLKLEDFTLTRIPRPRAIYTDPGSAPVTMKGFSDREGNGNNVVHNLRTAHGDNRGPSQKNGFGAGGGRGAGRGEGGGGGGMSPPPPPPSDMHLRVKQHSDGIIVGVTSSSSYYCPNDGYSSQNEGDGGDSAHRPRLRTPAEDVCAEEGQQASQRLLDVDQSRHLGDRGTMNPVFVDEGEDGVGGSRGREPHHH